MNTVGDLAEESYLAKMYMTTFVYALVVIL